MRRSKASLGGGRWDSEFGNRFSNMGGGLERQVKGAVGALSEKLSRQKGIARVSQGTAHAAHSHASLPEEPSAALKSNCARRIISRSDWTKPWATWA
eukprot:5280116-Pyramimonas_sp.AAC.1